MLHRSNPPRRTLALVIACAAVAFGVVPAEAQAFNVTISSAPTSMDVTQATAGGTKTFTAVADGDNINNGDISSALLTNNVVVDPGSGGGMTVLAPIDGTASGTGALTLDPVAPGNPLTISAAISTNGSQTHNGPVSLGADVTLSSPNVSAGAITLGSNALTVSGGGALNGAISGSGSLTKTGAGTLALQTSNPSFSGPTSIDGGTLSFVAGALGSGSLSISGGELQWSGNHADVPPVAIGSRGATFDTNSNDVTLGSVVSDVPTQSGSLTKVGDGTLRLDANNTYSGGTTVMHGLISFSSQDDLGKGNITLDGGGLQWALGNLDVSPRLNRIGPGGATFDTVNSDVAFTKPLTGSGSVTKQGAGTLALAGANTYSGTTEIANGRLDVPGGSSVAGPVLVDPGNELSVEGTISGRVTLASGGTVGCNNGTLGGGLTNNGGTALGAPNAPSGASATPGNGHATVSFTPGDAHCFPVGYTATASPGGVHRTAFGSPATVTPLTDGTTYTFTVTATNPIGSSPASGRSNAVKPLGPPPIARISFPANGQKFKFGQFVATEFSCLDGGGGPGISACTDSTHGNLVLDTSHPGTFKYSVIAVSEDGQATIAQILYVVLPPSNRFNSPRVHPNHDGSVSFSLKLPFPGTVDVLESAAKSNRATTASLKPGKGQFAFASVHARIKAAGTARFRIKPNAAGRALLRHHRHPVVIRLSITYTPAQGTPRTNTINTLRLTR